MPRLTGTKPSDAAGWVLGALVVLVIVSPLVEYGPAVWRRFQTLDFAHYQLSDAEFADAGNLRYLRDGLILLGCLGGLFAPGIDRRALRLFLGWELLLVGIGGVGHMLLPRPDLYVCGLRWLLNLQLAATVVLTLSSCSESFWRPFRMSFSMSVAGIMIFLLAGLVYQWTTLDFAVGMRLTSFLPQAEMVTELSQGIAFFAIAAGGSVAFEALALAQLVAVGFLTATRMAPVFAALLVARWPLIWLGGTRRRLPALTLLGLLIFAATAAASLPIASFVAQRGSVLEQQFHSARLSDWPEEFQLMTRQSLPTLLFGKGLGYRTTTAGTLKLDQKYGDPYIIGHENAVAALFAQTGGLGIVVIAAGVATLLGRLVDRAGGDRLAFARIAALVAVIFVLSMAGYWYEWPLFVQPMAVGIAWMLRPARRPFQHEDGLLGDPIGERAGGGVAGTFAGTIQ